MYFGSIVYLYAHPGPGWQFCSVTTTLMVNSFAVGTDGGGGASVVRGVTAVGRDDWEWSLKIRTAATLTPPASIANIASAASNLRRFLIDSPVGHIVTMTSRGTNRACMADVRRTRAREVPDGDRFPRFVGCPRAVPP